MVDNIFLLNRFSILEELVAKIPSSRLRDSMLYGKNIYNKIEVKPIWVGSMGEINPLGNSDTQLFQITT